MLDEGGYIIEQCRLCGCRQQDLGVPVLWRALLYLTHEIPMPKEWDADGRVSLFGQHRCADGRIGMTDVIGGEPYNLKEARDAQ